MTKPTILFPALVAIAVAATTASANEFEGPLRDLAGTELSGWVADGAIVEAIRAQNAEYADLTQPQIDEMDQTWRAEVGSGSRPMIDGILARPGSAALRSRKEASGGLVTEVFVTDAHGLNVVQSDVTSDYWQGDEAKWSETFGKPKGTVHIGDIELDESTQTYQSQVSLPVHDPETGEPIGAVTFGVDLSLLQ